MIPAAGATRGRRRPRAWHRLAGDLEIVDQLGPGPDGRALPGLRRVLDQLVQARVALAVTAGFDPHWHRSCCWAASMPSPAIHHMIASPGPPRNRRISACLR